MSHYFPVLPNTLSLVSNSNSMRSILSTIACAYQIINIANINKSTVLFFACGQKEQWASKVTWDMMCIRGRVHCSREGKYLFLSFFLKVAIARNVNSIPLPSRVHLWSIKNKNSLINKSPHFNCHNYETATVEKPFCQSQKITTIVPDFSLSISP